jgi:predicted phage-related endonuclease
LTVRVLTTASAGSPEWLAVRRGFIGGTASANIILGGRPDIEERDRPHGTPLFEYARLTGQNVGDEDSPLLEWGRRTESMHRDWLAELVGGSAEPAPGVVAHPTCGFLAVSPDGFLTTKSARFVLEMKLAIHGARKWRDDEPAPLFAQVQVSTVMSALDMDEGLISCLIPGAEPRWWIVARDRSFEQFMLDANGHFIEHHVRRGIPPPASGLDVDSRAIRRMFKGTDGSSVNLPIDYEAQIARLVDARAEARSLEAEESALKNSIQLAIGKAAEGRAGKARVACSWQSRGGEPFPVLKAFKN